MIERGLYMYSPNDKRYDEMEYRNCGISGLKIPIVALGLWHNFGGIDTFENARDMIRYSFDNGITHFDLANNYGPPPGSAEETFGQILRKDFASHRDEMVISSKAGYYMWPGPYGDFGSKKYLVSSLDQSLKRMGLDYVDVFYHHRYDPDTPLEETMSALDLIVRQGKALYVGLSNYYDSAVLKKALDILKDLGTPCILHQVRYSMLSREVETDVIQTAHENGSGTVCFSPLAQGLLTDKYLNGVPEDSRAAGASVFLKKENITKDVLDKVHKLNEIAQQRGQTLAQMALSWVVRDKRIASVIIGASKVSQIKGDIGILSASSFSKEELDAIDNILG